MEHSIGGIRPTIFGSDGEFNAVGIGVTASNDKYSSTWTLNPDSGQAYLIATMGL